MSVKALGTVEAFEEEKLKYRLEKNPAKSKIIKNCDKRTDCRC
jgi:hypothetical protein